MAIKYRLLLSVALAAATSTGGGAQESFVVPATSTLPAAGDRPDLWTEYHHRYRDGRHLPRKLPVYQSEAQATIGKVVTTQMDLVLDVVHHAPSKAVWVLFVRDGRAGLLRADARGSSREWLLDRDLRPATILFASRGCIRVVCRQLPTSTNEAPTYVEAGLPLYEVSGALRIVRIGKGFEDLVSYESRMDPAVVDKRRELLQKVRLGWSAQEPLDRRTVCATSLRRNILAFSPSNRLIVELFGPHVNGRVIDRQGGDRTFSIWFDESGPLPAYELGELRLVNAAASDRALAVEALPLVGADRTPLVVWFSVDEAGSVRVLARRRGLLARKLESFGGNDLAAALPAEQGRLQRGESQSRFRRRGSAASTWGRLPGRAKRCGWATRFWNGAGR
jgi:hypothetical protein